MTSALWMYSPGFPPPASVVWVLTSSAKLDYILMGGKWIWQNEFFQTMHFIWSKTYLFHVLHEVIFWNPTRSLMFSILFEISIVPLNTIPNRVMGSSYTLNKHHNWLLVQVCLALEILTCLFYPVNQVTNS